MYTYGWFKFRFDKKQFFIKQLSFNKKLIKKTDCWVEWLIRSYISSFFVPILKSWLWWIYTCLNTLEYFYSIILWCLCNEFTLRWGQQSVSTGIKCQIRYLPSWWAWTNWSAFLSLSFLNNKQENESFLVLFENPLIYYICRVYLARTECLLVCGWQRNKKVRWHHWFNRHEFEQTLGDG